MEETREQQKLHGFLQCGIYISIALEASIFIYKKAPIWGFFYKAVGQAEQACLFITTSSIVSWPPCF